MTDTEIDTTLKHLQTLFNFTTTTTTTDNALGTIDFLQQHLHSDQATLKAIIKRQPLLLGFQASTLREKLDWMQETFGWNRKELLKVVSKKPVLLSLSIHDTLQPTLDWFQETLNMTNPKLLSKVLKTYPYLLLSNNTDSLAGLAEKAEWLQKRLELETTEEISKVIGKKPEIIGYSMDAMDLRIKWLQKSLDFTDSETAKLIWKDPSLLGKSPEKNLEPTLNWLVHRFGHETAKKVVSRLPSVLGRSIQDSLEPKLEYLQTKFQLDEEGVLNMIGKLPTLFSVSCSNIDNTLQFYTERYGEDKVLQHVIGNPAYLGASLKKRLLPRWEQAVELGFAAEVPIFVLAAHTPKKWAIFVESKTADKVVAAN
ncbi:mTERF [Seminavis robusta]|uniref:mTERF n=1 Tax=Seminavis robusta TaxID=568900 RepID=A0A9N8DJZ6_9STRA|nr:mTERF [Seminavis robusta]|eukprot:Sro163_g073340.1 mTERF (369) ;mRNA; r:79827-80933